MAVAGDQLDRRREVLDGVTGAERWRVDLGEADRGMETVEPVALVRPDAGLEPPCRAGVGDIDRGPIETDSSGDGRVPLGNRDVATRAACEHDRRRSTDDAARLVPALVAVEQQRESAAATDVDERQRTDLVGDEGEEGHEESRTDRPRSSVSTAS